MNLLKTYSLYFLSFFISLHTAWATEKIDLSKGVTELTREYLALLNEQSKLTCSPGDYEHAGKLYDDYTGNGLYIPITDQDEVESETIKKYIPTLGKKRDWIKSEIAKLKKKKHFKTEFKRINALEKSFTKLHHQRYLLYKGKKNTLKSDLQKFHQSFLSFIESLSFLHSFSFPVDYFALRSSYDELLESSNHKLRREVYFKRKIYEDGAISPRTSRKDLFLRSLISTVYLRMKSFNGEFYDEDLRYDIESLIGMYKNTILKKRRFHLSSLKLWQKKVQEDINFYFKLIKAKQGSDFLRNIGQSKKRARKKLKDYTYKKEALVYKFWSTKDKIFRVLYAIETILFHEVGPLDNKFGSERISIIQVILNRLRNENYNDIDATEDLYSYLKEAGVKSTNNYTWLNVLFKKGQFSFTYFFIPASRGIFCPDGSRSAKKLREKNISLAVKGLKFPLYVFTPTRYFSRASMTGRIDMAKLWTGYKKWPQLSGPLIKDDKRLRKLKKKNKLIFANYFESSKYLFEVWRDKKKYYLYDPKRDQFNVYRNPHLFTYFFKDTAY